MLLIAAIIAVVVVVVVAVVTVVAGFAIAVAYFPWRLY